MSRHLAAAALALGLFAAPAAAQLEIHTLNIGRGDCAFLLSPTGTRVLIDTGKPGDGDAVIIPYLQSIGITGLDYVFISHYDGDHIGGMPELMAAGYVPMAVYDRGDLDAEMHTIWQDYVASIGVLRTTITVGMTIDFGGGVTAQNFIANGVIHTGPTLGVIGKVENAKSAGWRIDYGNFSYGTFGDISGFLEAPLGPILGNLDVYKASHHGSSTSSTTGFINDIDPDVTFVSSGLDSSNPRQAAINAINKDASMRWIYMTNDSVQTTRGAKPAFGHMKLTVTNNAYQIEGPTIRTMEFVCDEVNGLEGKAGMVALSEFMVDPGVVADIEGEYIEITNLTRRYIPLRGWVLSDNAGDSVTIASNAFLSPRQTILIGGQGDIRRNGGTVPHVVWPNNGFSLSNTGTDRIIIDTSVGTRLIDYTHNSGATSGRSWEGEDLLTAPGGGNLTLGSTVFGDGDRGSPGERNDADTTPWSPFISDVSPPQGPATGGNWITISGFDLAPYATPVIFVGRRAATAVQVLDDNTVRARVPGALSDPAGVSGLLTKFGKREGSRGLAADGFLTNVMLLAPGGMYELEDGYKYLPILEAPASIQR